MFNLEQNSRRYTGLFTVGSLKNKLSKLNLCIIYIIKLINLRLNELKLNLKNESSHLSTLSVKIFRLGASSELKKMKTVQDTKISQFQSSARNLLIKVIEKIQERSPLVFKVTHYLSVLYPTQIVSVKHTTLET